MVTKEVLDDQHKPNHFTVLGHCFQHCNSLGSTSLTVSCFGEYYKTMYISAKYFGMSGSFLRVLYVSKEIAIRCAEFTTEPVAEIWIKARIAIKGLVAAKHTKGVVFREFVGDKPTWPTDLDWCFDMVFNASLMMRADGKFLHACTDDDCCPEGIESLRRKMLVVMLRIILRCRPMIPMLSRWGLTGPTTDFLMLVIGVCNVPCFWNK